MSANWETSSVSVTMHGVVAFIHRTHPRSTKRSKKSTCDSMSSRMPKRQRWPCLKRLTTTTDTEYAPP